MRWPQSRLGSSGICTPALGAPQPEGSVVADFGKLTFLAPEGAIAQRLCGRRVAASAPVQEPAPRPGEDLGAPGGPPALASEPCRCSQLRHAPPGSAVAAGPPAAGLRAAWHPQPSALCRPPRRVSGNPAAAGRERGAKADSGLRGALASEKWAFGFLLDLCFLSHAQLHQVLQNQRVPSAVSSAPNPFPSHLL